MGWTRWLPGSKSERQDATPKKYEELVDRLLDMHDDEKQRVYIRCRWLELTAGARDRMRRDERWFGWGNFVTLGASAITPVLVTATAATTGDARTTLTVTTTLISLVAAIGAVLLQVLRPGVRWRLQRRTRDELEGIAWRYLADVEVERTEPARKQAWKKFVVEVEQAGRRYNETYAQEIAGGLGDTQVRPETVSTAP
jgi:hypothetical protein